MVKTNCSFCKKYIEKPYAWYKRVKRNFCSKKCLASWQSENVRGKNHHQYKASSHRRICKRCKRIFKPHNKKSTFCSYKCKGEYVRNNYHGRYKISGHSYGYIHWWLKEHYGSAVVCENYYCDGRSKHFEWALLEGKDYERKRENFWQLCKKCHLAYDKPRLVVSKVPI